MKVVQAVNHPIHELFKESLHNWLPRLFLFLVAVNAVENIILTAELRSQSGPSWQWSRCGKVALLCRRLSLEHAVVPVPHCLSHGFSATSRPGTTFTLSHWLAGHKITNGGNLLGCQSCEHDRSYKEGSKRIWNECQFLLNYTAQHPRYLHIRYRENLNFALW